MKRLLTLLLGVSTILVADSCAKNPVTGKRQISLVSSEQEAAMGAEADPQIVAQYGLYPDQQLQAFINEKGKQMGAISHRPEINYQFRIVDSEILNAFAVPGGYVYFTRGIMAHFNNEAEFAGVLGHEIGHITARHSAQQQTKQQLYSGGLLLGMILSPQVAQFGEAASQGLQLLFLKNGRDDERQSDELGVEYSTKINYDAQQMANFFQTLQRQGEKQGSAELPTFLSTHPNPGDRFTTVSALAQKVKAANPGKTFEIGRNSYLRRIEGLIIGEDPKQGFLENSVFYHPELRFQFSAPRGWQYQNSPQRVNFGEPNGKALLFLSLAQGNSLQAAAQTALQGFGLTAVQSDNTTVNGLPALAVIADQRNAQTGAVGARTLSYFIQQGNTIYQLLGASSPAEFQAYTQTFLATMQSFRPLTDQSKINKQPERVRVKTAARSSTLQQALQSFNVPANRMEEHAILNGMRLTENLTQGMLFKVIQ